MSLNLKFACALAESASAPTATTSRSSADLCMTDSMSDIMIDSILKDEVHKGKRNLHTCHFFTKCTARWNRFFFNSFQIICFVNKDAVTLLDEIILVEKNFFCTSRTESSVWHCAQVQSTSIPCATSAMDFYYYLLVFKLISWPTIIY